MKKIITATILAMPLLVNASQIDKCKACHGQHFEKKAMGQSKIVKNMSEEDIRKALNGYKNGTYGGKMKVIMFGQVKQIKNIEKAAKHIKAVSSGHEFKCIENNESIENLKKIDIKTEGYTKSEAPHCEQQEDSLKDGDYENNNSK